MLKHAYKCKLSHITIWRRTTHQLHANAALLNVFRTFLASFLLREIFAINLTAPREFAYFARVEICKIDENLSLSAKLYCLRRACHKMRVYICVNPYDLHRFNAILCDCCCCCYNAWCLTVSRMYFMCCRFRTCAHTYKNWNICTFNYTNFY